MYVNYCLKSVFQQYLCRNWKDTETETIRSVPSFFLGKLIPSYENSWIHALNYLEIKLPRMKVKVDYPPL